jgi:hypothetical protein
MDEGIKNVIAGNAFAQKLFDIFPDNAGDEVTLDGSNLLLTSMKHGEFR